MARNLIDLLPRTSVREQKGGRFFFCAFIFAGARWVFASAGFRAVSDGGSSLIREKLVCEVCLYARVCVDKGGRQR